MMKSIGTDIIAILFLIGLLLTFIPPETIKQYMGESSSFLSTITSAIVGSITLIPAFVAFPLVDPLSIGIEKGLDEEDILYVNKDYCIGCGICTKLSPNNFKIENKKAIVINSNIDVENYEHIKKTIDKCTANAITLKNKKDA